MNGTSCVEHVSILQKKIIPQNSLLQSVWIKIWKWDKQKAEVILSTFHNL